MRRNIHPDQCENLESITKLQAKPQDWQPHRAGRITSPTFYTACKGDHLHKTTLDKIMCYHDTIIQVLAVVWGKCYKTHQTNKTHQNVTVSLCGFVIRPVEPPLGASPDGKVVCSCSGEGVLEIKCPYKYRLWQSVRISALTKHSNQWRHTSTISRFNCTFACNVQYCDFVVWTTQELVSLAEGFTSNLYLSFCQNF